MRRPSATLFLLAALALGCARTMVMAPAPPPVPEGPVQDPIQGPAAAPELSLEDAIPIDPAILTGRLDNGLTYFVRRNSEPPDRVELRLVVDAGSVLEDDDQLGLAHFVEHMAFNGTSNFAEGELVDYFEGIGMQFGADLNASTGFDETVYSLRVPAEPELLARGFEVLADWAGGILFEPQAVDRERDVVIEEWRLGRGAGARIRDQQLPLLFRGSRYADRLPIGTPEILESAPVETLRRFYRDWYRPELMAVVAVGDYDPAAMESWIRDGFASLETRSDPRPRPVVPVPGHTETLVGVTTDPEVTVTSVAVYTKLGLRPEGTVADYRRQLAEGLYHSMLNRRLDELRRRPEPPFLWASSSTGGFLRSSDVYVQSAGVRSGELLGGLAALLTEIERVDRHGFTAGELDRAGRELLRAYERGFAERDKTPSAAFAAEYARHYLVGEPAPGIAVELDLVERYLPTLGLAELNRLAAEWISEENRVVLVTAPQSEADGLPDEELLVAALAAADEFEPDPWVDRVRDRPLVGEPPTPGAVVATSELPALGVTEWRLSNGVRVVLKPTDFRNDQVSMVAFSPGGHSLAGDDEFISAVFADTVLGQGGLGEFDRSELQKALAGKAAAARTFIGELEEGLSAGGSPDDLETILQLAYLSFTSPRADAAAFAGWKTRTSELLHNRLARPEAVFSDRLSEVLTSGHPRYRPPTEEMLEEIDLERALAFHRQRFADAAGFTFVVVGSFDVDSLQPLVETWLGGLPALGVEESWLDVGVERPAGTVEVEVSAGLEPKSQVRLVLHGPAVWSREENHLLGSLIEALEIRLREILREDLGATYGVGVSGSISSRPRQEFTVSISFGCAPERAESLLELVIAELAEVRENGFEEETISKIREQQRRQREEGMKQNDFWIGVLASAYRLELDPMLILDFDTLVDSLTTDSLRDAARRYLVTDRSLRAVLYPESGAPNESEPGAAD
jgi:zinc protease